MSQSATKLSKSSKKDFLTKSLTMYNADPLECPFREYRDQELGNDLWGLGPISYRAAVIGKAPSSKPAADYVWMDEQTQPLPRSVRHYLHGWKRAEELATARWNSEVVIFEDTNNGKMSVIEMQLSHAQVLLRSSFCRKVLSACFMLERIEGMPAEHLWEGFTCTFIPDGWRPRYHVYSPGLKAGGGPAHRPILSKSGCYLVRLYYLGAWRCVWVSDQVPIDANESPLLPFCPLISHVTVMSKASKQITELVQSRFVHLWPLLLCKALLKLAAPDMNTDEDIHDLENLVDVEDEEMENLDILHCLTGTMSVVHFNKSYEEAFLLMQHEVTNFTWGEGDTGSETVTSTVKSKAVKKVVKEKEPPPKHSAVTLCVEETLDEPPWALPGITPAHELTLVVTMVRDIPIKKPAPEPEVPLWKTYRWVDWARRHGLWEAYACPRTRFLKVNGLMKLSHAPHLLDVQSTESITCFFREEQEKAKKTKEATKSATLLTQVLNKEELREWVPYLNMYRFLKYVNVVYFPSLHQFTSACSSPVLRVVPTKAPPNRAIDMTLPAQSPLYLQIDNAEANKLKMSINVIDPRVLSNCSVSLIDYVEPSYVVLEVFEWFKDEDLPTARAYVETRGYNAVEVHLKPGRHFCRVWIQCHTNCHLAVLSESNILLGPRDLIINAAHKECLWGHKFLSNLGVAFNSWLRVNRSTPYAIADHEFYREYQPDLDWDEDLIGHKKSSVHWMFRQALYSLLKKRLAPLELHNVCGIMRSLFRDPNFGFPPMPSPPKPLRDIVAQDICDCVSPEGLHEEEEDTRDNQSKAGEGEEVEIPENIMNYLLSEPEPPSVSRICDLATEDAYCSSLKKLREKEIQRHEAATLIQARWRGAWTRKCLDARNLHAVTPHDIIKLLNEHVLGHIDGLSMLMNEFFKMFPGARYAYSVGSALGGVYGLEQHYGISTMTPSCKWIPYFHALFYCHDPVKIHFDVQSNLPYSTLSFYDNDDGEQLPQVFGSHITFNVLPNYCGYTLVAHGITPQPIQNAPEVTWTLSVMTSPDKAFHNCDNEPDMCTVQPIMSANKLANEEIYVPNKRNSLGGMVLHVAKNESISFKVTTTSPNLEIEAILRTINSEGEEEEVARCHGTGTIFWAFLMLKAEKTSQTEKFGSQSNIFNKESVSARIIKKKASVVGKPKSATKIKDLKAGVMNPNHYFIEVVAPGGWPLKLEQWRRADIARNLLDPPTSKKSKSASSKRDGESKHSENTLKVIEGDAFTLMECSYSIGGGITVKRDDRKEILFAAARQAWEMKDPGRNSRGQKFRKQFREEFLVNKDNAGPSPSVPEHHGSEERPASSTTATNHRHSWSASTKEIQHSDKDIHDDNDEPHLRQLTPASTSDITIEEEENPDRTYLKMPEQLRDIFKPLPFIEECSREVNIYEDPVLMSPDIAEANNQERHGRIERAIERMNDLQTYNDIYVLRRQKRRCRRLESVGVNWAFSPDIMVALEDRDYAVSQELLIRQMSAASKKKQDKDKGKGEKEKGKDKGKDKGKGKGK